MRITAPENDSGSPKANSPRVALLEVAERLFAESGIDAVSIRDITGAAGANVGAVNYYFGSKLGLLDALVDRRLKELADRRRPYVEALDAAGRSPSVRAVVEAFVRPLAELVSEEGRTGQYYVTLLARVTLADLDLPSLRDRRQLSTRYQQLYQRAMPGIDAPTAAVRVAMATTLALEVLGRPLGDGRPTSLLLGRDSHDLASPLIDFIVGGLSGPPSSENADSSGSAI
ncbi:TetR/AcrR family transcriptional regulator [Rhodococcus sp. NPDC003322]